MGPVASAGAQVWRRSEREGNRLRTGSKERHCDRQVVPECFREALLKGGAQWKTGGPAFQACVLPGRW